MSFHPLKSGRNQFIRGLRQVVAHVSIPSSRVGTRQKRLICLVLKSSFHPLKSGRNSPSARMCTMNGLFPSPQVGSEPLHQIQPCPSATVSIPSSRVGTQSFLAPKSAKHTFPSPQVGSEHRYPEGSAVGRERFHPLKSGRNASVFLIEEEGGISFHPLKSGRNARSGER